MNLLDEQLNLAMCEWIGWTDCHKSLASNQEQQPHERCFIGIPPDGIIHRRLPNYLSDDSPRRLLNEAEARLTAAQSREYSGRLLIHLGFNREIPFFTKSGSATVEFELMCGAFRSASARQRTIAILKTVKPEMFL